MKARFHLLAALAALFALSAILGACAGQKQTQQGQDGPPSGQEQADRAAGAAQVDENGFDYPKSPRGDVVTEHFGTEVADPYRWLEDGDSEQTRKWVRKQDGLTRDYLEGIDGREELRERFRELFYIDAMSSPTPRGGRLFYSRQHADKEKDVYYWRPADGDGEDEKVLLDPNKMGDGENVSVGTVRPSLDGKKVAYTLKENNADQATLYVKDLESGAVSDIDVIEGARWAYPDWKPDGSGFFYTRYPTDSAIPKDERPGKADIRYHELGTDPAGDRVVREPTDNPRTFQGASLSRDGRWLVNYVQHGWNRSDVYIQDLEADGDEPTWTPVSVGKEYSYDIDVWEDTLYIITDEGAPKFRMFKAPAEAPQRDNWTEIVPERKDAVLKYAQVIGGRLVLTYLKDAHSVLRVHGLDGEMVREVELPGLGSTYGMSGEVTSDTAYFAYQSFTEPKRIYQTSVEKGGTELWSREELPVDPSKFTSEQVWYESKDGTKVSMFVVHKKGAELNGEMPFLLYGYGGFNVSLTPYFRESIIPWMEAGGGFAMANLRGGGEYGEDWHEAGMLHNKQNTFDDFIAAAEHLIDEGYTSSDRLAIEGGSNGGLLVSAATVQRPNLFGAVLCHVPLTDMVRFPKFGPARLWIPEYGDPSKKEDFEYLFGYSPYHNVEQGAEYPAFLMLSTANDDRVHPMHARKMTAALQWAQAGDEPVLFRLEKKAGHGGADLIKSTVEEKVDVFSFLRAELATPAGER